LKPQRILVTGFPHCGTTILRAKIGDCKDVYDSVGEFAEPQNYSTNIPNKWFVWKCPFLHSEFRNNTFSIKKDTWLEHDIIIPIIRNPWNVFTSLHRRGVDNNDFNVLDNKQGHSPSYYINAAHVILDAFEKKYDKVYPIKYEDMFDNDFEKLREIFDSIGLEYDESLFYSRTKIYKHNSIPFVEDYDVTQPYAGEIRAWQINQPFQNMNGDVNIPNELSDILENSTIIKELGYSDPRITG
jgi:hypothetical protein